VMRMKKNIGFGPAVNYGIRQSKGDFIVILNNDTMVSPGWLGNLLAPLENDSCIGIVSPVTNYVGEGPQIDDRAKHLPPELDVIERYAKSIAGRSDVIYEPNRLVFFCVLLRRELIDMIGYLDEGYEKGNFEDDDYCLRARMAGYRLAIAGNSFVYHHGSATFTKNRISHSQYMERNRERFYKKVGRIATYNQHLSPPQSVGKNEVSVVIRTKNRPVLLKRALTSMANQTFKDFEVVVVNDGGEDIAGLLNPFGTQFPIRYVRHDTSRGRTAAINAGIKHSRGNWISYLDDDDIVYPWHLETLFQAAQNSKAKFVYSDFNRALFLRGLEITTPDILQGAPPWEYNRRDLLVQNYIPIHTWLHARDCIEKAGLWDETFDRLEDYEFLLRVSANNSFHHLKRVTCEYRYYVESANSIYTDRHKTLDALEKIYRRNPVADPDLLAKRQVVMDASKRQVQRIEEILNQAGSSTPDATTIREIIRVVVGI
jgi:GT2 family glycosyltransferase